MAKVYREKRPTGTYAYVRYKVDGKYKKIGLGYAFKKKNDVHIEGIVSELENRKAMNLPADPQLEEKLKKCSEEFLKKLEKAGLVTLEKSPNLLAFLDDYINRKNLSDASDIKLNQVKNKIVEFFGHDKRLRDINTGLAEDFRTSLENEGKAPATISRIVRYGRQFFGYALKKEFIQKNPFSDLKAGGESNRGRIKFIERETIDRVIAVAPSTEWKVLISLWRYGGLRHDEPMFLLWEDIDWESKRIRVSSPKTEKQGKGERTIPLFSELQPVLDRLREEKKANSNSVITSYRSGQNLRTQFNRLVRKAGLEVWTRPVQNLRASRQKEIEEEFGMTCATAWIGNSESVAKSNYLKVRDADFERAISTSGQMVVTQTGEFTGKQQPEKSKTGELTVDSSTITLLQEELIGQAGLEPATKGL